MTINLEGSQLLRACECAAYLSVSERHVLNLANAGLLTPHRLGRAVRFDPAEVIQLGAKRSSGR